MTPPEVVGALRDAVEQRRRELRLTPSKLVDRVGFSASAVANVRKGYRREYADDFKWAFCEALGWTPDSIDRLLAGDQPEIADGHRPVLTPITGIPVTERVPQLSDDQLVDLLEGVDRLAVTVADILERLSVLEQRPPHPGGTGTTGE